MRPLACFVQCSCGILSVGWSLVGEASGAWLRSSRPSQEPQAVVAQKQEQSGESPELLSALPVSTAVQVSKEQQAIQQLCHDIEALYHRNRWGSSGCEKIPFEVFGESAEGRPLLMFLSESSTLKKSPDKSARSKLTLVQCGIHGDELPSVPMCFRLMGEILDGKRELKGDQRLVVQPLVNPDGMLKTKPTRHNARGVDINRNFPTKNWISDALKSWAKKDRKDPRKFPGHEANSEPETQAVVKFIREQKPQKIISVHTPLGFLDLDARGRNKDHDRRARFLAINIVKNSGNYKFRNFGVYPGSLGNYCGRERGIPVYTLELPGGASPATIDQYWQRFRAGFWRAIDFDLDTGEFAED